MRSTGKTTRLVNLAIETLFRNGSITILFNKDIFDPNERWKDGLDVDEIKRREMLIDIDAAKDNDAQFYFIKKFENRILLEHRGQVTRKGTTYVVNKS